MEIDIKELRARLDKEIARGNPNLAEFIHREIRLAETMKASLMEEMSSETANFLTDTAAKVDNYVFQLQEIEKELGLKNLSLDQKVALKDNLVRDEIANQQERLDEMEQHQ